MMDERYNIYAVMIQSLNLFIDEESNKKYESIAKVKMDIGREIFGEFSEGYCEDLIHYANALKKNGK